MGLEKTVIIGARGQLGQDLVTTFPGGGELVALGHEDIEVCDPEQVAAKIEALAPTTVINLAAFHKTDLCEDEVEKTLRVNAVAPGHLAAACKRRGATLVFFSTDYVFSGEGNRPWSEDDPTAPVNVYGMSKRAGESMVETYAGEYVIFRVSGLFGRAGSSGKGGNFVETMIRLGKEGKPIQVVNDQVLAPTHTRELAARVWEVLAQGGRGLFHCTAAGECSWFDFAAEIFRQLGLNPPLSPQTTAESGAKARRPAYSVLKNARLGELGMAGLKPWPAGLNDYLVEKHGAAPLPA